MSRPVLRFSFRELFFFIIRGLKSITIFLDSYPKHKSSNDNSDAALVFVPLEIV